MTIFCSKKYNYNFVSFGSTPTPEKTSSEKLKYILAIIYKAKKKIVCLKAHACVCEIGRFGQTNAGIFFYFHFYFIKENLPVVR